MFRAYLRAFVFWVSFLKKRKGRQKPRSTETLSTLSSILVFYPGCAARHLCLALNASHPFLDFGETIGFNFFFASYFVLHNSYIKILTIHRYKSSWIYSKDPTVLNRRIEPPTNTFKSVQYHNI